jgi:hypothetical protein
MCNRNFPRRFVLFFLCISAIFSETLPLTTITVSKTGRRVQLDGFLLEWVKDSAKPICPGASWTWDALNTKEGLTGYFKAPASAGNDWIFTFLPQRLSPYSKIFLSFSPDSAKPFFRVSRPESSLDSSLVAEWVLPWQNITTDSLGVYQIGVAAFDKKGDTLPAMIFTGRAFRQQSPAPWGKVYSKAIFLVILLCALFYVQRKIKRTALVKKKRNGPQVRNE